MKRKIFLSLSIFVIVFSISLLSTGNAFGASRVGYYTLTIPSGTVVTMGDSSVTLPITVTNLPSSTDSIRYIRLDFNANVYYISRANTAPSNWTVSEIKNAGVGQTYIIFTAANGIAPGNSQTFNVILTGSNNGNIPSAASDQTDSIVDDSNSTVMTISGANSNYFSRNATGNSDTWQRKALYSSISASPSTTGSGGTITITMTVTNRSSVSLSSVQPLIMSVTGSAGASLSSGPTPASVATLNVLESATFQWTYTASGSGSLQFCNSAKNGTGTATSLTACSNYVAVGDFTASLSISPSQIISGQSVTVTMTVRNNGSTTLHSITPSSLNFEFLSGNATRSCSTSTPGTIGNLGAGASATFQWDCTITSTQVGSTFRFNGYAMSDTLNSTPTPAYSNVGTISAYSVTVSPDTAYYLDTNKTFTFRVTNNGGYPIYKVRITTASTGFVYSAASGGCTGNWTVSTSGSPTVITFSTGTGCTCGTSLDCIPCSGGACNFSVTYSNLPDVSQNVNSNVEFNFRIDVWDTPLTGDDPRASLGAIVKITQNGVTLEVIPDLSLAPACTATLIATVTPAPADGSTIEFSNGETATTVSGEAQAIFRSPIPYSNASTTVSATYQGASATKTINLTNATPCPKKIRWREVVQ